MKNIKKRIRISFDLDGVVASPLLDGALINLRILKEHLLRSLGDKKGYFYPKTSLERRAWSFLNNLRTPNKDLRILQKIKGEGTASLYLITGRFNFLEKQTLLWLEKHNLNNLFDKIFINTKDLNPTAFKSKILGDEAIDFHLDDDLEVIKDLRTSVSTKISWLNGGRGKPKHSPRFSSLKDFIEDIKLSSESDEKSD